jgi:hypothetical protein
MSTSWGSTTWVTSCGHRSCCHACRRTPSETLKTGSHRHRCACVHTYMHAYISQHSIRSQPALHLISAAPADHAWRPHVRMCRLKILPAFMCSPAQRLSTSCIHLTAGAGAVGPPPPPSPVRVVNVSSLAHTFGRINFDDLMSKKDYQPWVAYGETHTVQRHSISLI